MRDVAVATVTLARNDGEGELLERALRRLASLGARVFVADGGSPPDFVDEVRAIPHVTLAAAEGPGLVWQARASLGAAAASGAQMILYTEPDKEAFFAGGLEWFVERAPAGPDRGIIVASRSKASFATYPPMQRRVETSVNDLASTLIGTPGDYSYGPFLLGAGLASHLHRAPLDVGWGWRPFLFVTAHRLGLRVEHVEGDFPCPPAQRHEDDVERIHRLRQLGQNAAGLALALAPAPDGGER